MVFCWVCHHYHDFSLNSCKQYPKWSSCFHSFPPSTSLMHGYLRSFSKAYPDHNILFHYNLQWLPIVPTSSLSFLAWHTRLSLFWSESSFLALSSADPLPYSVLRNIRTTLSPPRMPSVFFLSSVILFVLLPCPTCPPLLFILSPLRSSESTMASSEPFDFPLVLIAFCLVLQLFSCIY